MSVERALNRQDFARILEKAYELEEARIVGSVRARPDSDRAVYRSVTAVGLRPGRVGHVLGGFEKTRQRAGWRRRLNKIGTAVHRFVTRTGPTVKA